MAGGCHLDRPIKALIESSGFKLDCIDMGYARGPKLLTYFYEGRARP
ncbi:hypothetical protein N177_0060 [Lutibaculum baratangense AMV1]|uniref:Uncharacterized protein n=1 Tax=Lutibaculum baratangense AMV1 TaxID=631454 RepID=V4RN95_9HYPH|nr:hypothetical protein N177_0060 [Lutibaculum baratangense AMV1]